MNWYVWAVLKSLLALAAVIVYTRISGRKQVSRMTFYDFVVGVALGTLAASIALDVQGNTGKLLWVFLVLALISVIAGRLPHFQLPVRKYIENQPVVVIHNGRIMHQNLRKAHFNIERLLNQLRERKINDVSDVEFAIVADGGVLSVLLKPPGERGPAPESEVSEASPTLTRIIVDGMVQYNNLRLNNLDEQWLISELTRAGFNSPREIAAATLQENGRLLIEPKPDQAPPASNWS